MPLWVTNSIRKLLFFYFLFTNSKLILIRKMKEQNLYFEVIEMKYYPIQNYLKKIKACWILWFCDLALGSHCLWSWDYSGHSLRDAIVFFEKNCCCYIFLLLSYVWYLHKYWDSIGWCKFMDISIYKIIEYHSVAVSKSKNEHI